MPVRRVGHHEGVDVVEVALGTAAGARAAILSWGALVRDLVVPAAGGPQRVVLGFDGFEPYPHHSPNFGVIAGRFANRIGGARFVVDGVAYRTDANQAGRHTLHGGRGGFGKRAWRLADAGPAHATLVLVSPAGDMGFPGTATAVCTYRLLEPATLRVELTGTSDAPTPFGLAHHSYFNLDASADVADHTLQLEADFYTPTDEELIPTGEIRPVAGTPYDFRQARPIAPRGQPAPRYDTNFVLRHRRGAFARAAVLTGARAGLAMEVWTSEPGLQVYDGHKLAVAVPGLGGARYGARAGLCLEPQLFPDAPNVAHFPCPVLRPGAVYRQVTEYRFARV